MASNQRYVVPTRDIRVDSAETSDAYRHVLAKIGRWRIVRCKDDLQFIVQRRQAGSARFPWRALAYVLNETALPAVLERLSMPKEDLLRVSRAFFAPEVLA